MTTEPIIPDYSGPNLAGIVPSLLGIRSSADESPRSLPTWFPAGVGEAQQVCLLILDGLGWEQLRDRSDIAPTLAALQGGPITSVAPTTTATALTSIATGLTPAEHGLIGYRMAISGEVLNVLRWSVDGSDRSRQLPPAEVQRFPAFLGERVPVISPMELGHTAFSAAHLGGAEHRGYRAPSSLPVAVGAALREGAPFVYAYYGGVDKIAHERGFGAYYDAELAFADQLVSQIIEGLPPGAALLVTSDHGQVEVGDRVIVPSSGLLAMVAAQSGEGRFRWFHAKHGATEELYAGARDEFAATGWILRRSELLDMEVFGPTSSPQVQRRMGDIAVLAREPVSYYDPDDTGPFELVCRHGSLTSAEVLVPFVASPVAT